MRVGLCCVYVKQVCVCVYGRVFERRTEKQWSPAESARDRFKQRRSRARRSTTIETQRAQMRRAYGIYSAAQLGAHASVRYSLPVRLSVWLSGCLLAVWRCANQINTHMNTRAICLLYTRLPPTQTRKPQDVRCRVRARNAPNARRRRRTRVARWLSKQRRPCFRRVKEFPSVSVESKRQIGPKSQTQRERATRPI